MRKINQFLVSLLLLFSMQINALPSGFDDSYTFKNPNRNDYRPEVGYLRDSLNYHKTSDNKVWCTYEILNDDGPDEIKKIVVNLSSFDFETISTEDISKIMEADRVCYEGRHAFWEGKIPTGSSWIAKDLEALEFNYLSKKKKWEELLAIKNGKGANTKSSSAQRSSSSNYGNSASDSGQSNQYNQYDKSPLADLSSAAGFNQLDPSKQVIIKRDRVKVGARKYKD